MTLFATIGSVALGAIGSAAGAVGATDVAATLGTLGAVTGGEGAGVGAAGALANIPGTLAGGLGSTAAATTGNAAIDAMTGVPNLAAATGAAPTTGSAVADTALVSGGMGGIQQGVQAGQQAQAVKAQNKGYKQLAGQQAADLAQTKQQQEDTLGGGRSLAEGGGVNLQSGQFVIPADIVSDLGNGDTKAGMEFLRQFFETGGHA